MPFYCPLRTGKRPLRCDFVSVDASLALHVSVTPSSHPAVIPNCCRICGPNPRAIFCIRAVPLGPVRDVIPFNFMIRGYLRVPIVR